MDGGTAGAERVADGKEARVYQSHDVAWVGLFNRLPVTAKEPVRSRHPDLPVQPRMIDHHVLLESARYDTQKCHSIAMLWVHVRLNLEDKSGELLSVGCTGPIPNSCEGPAVAASWRNPFRKGSTPKFVKRAPEEDRRELAGEKSGYAIELWPAPVKKAILLSCSGP